MKDRSTWLKVYSVPLHSDTIQGKNLLMKIQKPTYQHIYEEQQVTKTLIEPQSFCIRLIWCFQVSCLYFAIVQVCLELYARPDLKRSNIFRMHESIPQLQSC